jgi:CMP-2-keto-3-deoxyoctulosonic acid synthetase
LENGGRIKIAITKHLSIPIDTIEDVEKVKHIIQSNR